MSSDPVARAKADSPSYTISLHIKHPTIDPETITKQLGLTPDHAWACGEPKRSASSESAGVRRNSFWCATLVPPSPSAVPFSTAAGESAKFQRALDIMASDVGSYLNLQLLRLRRHQSFVQQLLDDGAELSFVVELPTAELGGFKLDPSVTRQIGTLGATLEFQFI